MLEVPTPEKREIADLLYSLKHSKHGYKFQALVSPEEMCLHISKLEVCTKNDKRIFDESELAALLKTKVPTPAHIMIEKKHSCLFDSWYQGVMNFLPKQK
jgi:hypothetical protein